MILSGKLEPTQIMEMFLVPIWKAAGCDTFKIVTKDDEEDRDHRCPSSDRQQTSKKVGRGMKPL